MSSRTRFCRGVVAGVVGALAVSSAWAAVVASSPPVPGVPLPRHVAAVVGGAPPAFEMDLPLGGANRTVRLEPHDLRSPGFTLRIAYAGGLEQRTPAPSRVLRGSVDGVPDAVVVGSWRDDGLHLLVTGLGPTLVVEPAGDPLHVFVREAEPLADSAGLCAVVEGASAAAAGGGVAGADCSVGIELATDADVEFFTLNGRSVDDTLADIELVLAGVDALYAAQLGLPVLHSAAIVRTEEEDPYSSKDPLVLLDELADEWSDNQAGVSRDVAHLFTGKNLIGAPVGAAFTPGACTAEAYSLAQSKWSSTFEHRVWVTAHELGHNLGAIHCNAQAECGLMCSTAGGCTLEPLEVGAFSTAQILEYAAGAVCLGSSGPAGITATDGTACDAIEVTFTPAPGALSHTLWRADHGDPVSQVTLLATDVVSPYFDTSVPTVAAFDYWVSAVFADGCESGLVGPAKGSTPALIDPTAVVLASDTSCQFVSVAWIAVPGNSGYEVWRGPDDDSANALFLAADSLSPYVDSSAVPGETSRYWVRTVNSCGAPGPFGAGDLGTRKGLPAALEAFASDLAHCDAVEVTWGPSPGATSFTVRRGETPDPEQSVVIATVTSSPYLDETAAPGVTFWYWVQAKNSCGAGDLGPGDPGVAGVFADLSGDCIVDTADLGLLLAAWDEHGGPADLNGDGIVDGADLGLLQAEIGGR